MMTEYTPEMGVELLRSVASDRDVIEAAQVSHTAINEQERVINPDRFINALVRQRHGSPFEHGYFKFRVSGPIFMVREFFRHRIGFSYNEISGRYAVLPAKFYVPDAERPLVNVGTSMKPRFEQGTEQQQLDVEETMVDAYEHAYNAYEFMLEQGIAKEMARAVLPVGIFTEFIVSCNPRSMMAFLSLRTSDSGLSFPQYEIENVAKKMEEAFKHLMPITHAAFEANGRIAP